MWDGMLDRFGARHRCIAPDLRGFGESPAPPDVEAYRARHLVADVVALIESLGRPVRALVAHDWGGAVAWSVTALRPDLVERLVIVNSPHPATFLRALQSDPAQQAASAYINFLCRDDAETLLAENDYARMWPLFTNMGAADSQRPGGGWLTEAVRDRYRAVWSAGLRGGCNYYRASPLRPPTVADDRVMRVVLPDEAVTVRVPTTVVWADGDIALLPCLLDGLDRWVPELRVVRVPDATHWIVHEQPDLVAAEIEWSLSR